MFKSSFCLRLRHRGTAIPHTGRRTCGLRRVTGRGLVRCSGGFGIGLIYAGSIRFMSRRGTRTRSELVYLDANGSLSSPGHVLCSGRR